MENIIHQCSKEAVIATLQTSLLEYDKRVNDVINHIEKTLKELILIKIENLDDSAKLLNHAINERLDNINKFREALKDQSVNFITRNEFDLKIERINVEKNLRLDKVEGDIQELRESKAKLEGKADQSDLNKALLFSVISTILSIIAIVVRFLK